ncbi:MBL fold metallo-hydrolase [Streptomyces sp. H34-S4]|uniref:MBL fold metallo-hydrolase n=1 Tax=Streptomyces sp. H34-S4 TaxID=2996463 RepID=UPI00226EDBF8|nr:MBL fold metallo-hydrolase [Streptomyces sp. H34-S4]MCY0935134.1 MBL fold metallo-hydrolase [Streptomyces sp. H34-S4]
MHAATLAGPADAVVTEVADGVHAYVQPPGGWCLNNAGILANGGQSALVDTAATESRARRLRRAALRLAPRPPRAVINTHFHGDHTYGNFVFPEALTIGHERTRTMVRAAGLHMAGLWPDVCWGDIEITPPELTFRDRTTLHVGAIRAEIVHIGPAAHTTDDTVVWLPDQGVLFAGDLVMNGVTPFCVMGSVRGSLRALERLRALGATTIVPGHGPVGGPEILDANEGYLRWIQGLAEEGAGAGSTPLDLARATGLGPYAGLLDAERLLPNLHRAYAEEQGLPEGSPLDIPAVFEEMAVYHGSAPVCHA